MKKHTILWADDDPDDLMLLHEVLQETANSFEIIEVRNGRKAMDYLQTAKQKAVLPCLIILDMNMPIFSGRDALASIKSDETLKHIPVVIFTTSASTLDRTFCKKWGAEMIIKPPTLQNFKQTIQQLLAFCAFQNEEK